ncbi:MAG: hypothetical protein WA996_18850 [Candidatus Promineifilaceae bacterium]
MKRIIPEELNPYTRKKFEAIHSYDPFESVITALNQDFHHSYNLLIHNTHQSLGRRGHPVIIMERDRVILLHNGQQESFEVIPHLYHLIKSISHISFGIYVILANNDFGPLKEEVRHDLLSKRELIKEALSILDDEPIPANHLESQRRTLQNGLTMIEDVLASGDVDPGQIRNFGSNNAPLYLKNAALTVSLELDVLHDTVMKWKEKMSPENWANVYVVVCAGHQARYREASKQYFQRLLHDKEGLGADRENRVVYAESIHDVNAALDLLARHIIDQRASIELFSDRTRLQQDLMSDGAAAYLEELLPGNK